MNTTYDGVHNDLLIGINAASRITPIHSASKPATIIHAVFAAGAAPHCSHRPVNTPNSNVATAGKVLSSPSGSHVF